MSGIDMERVRKAADAVQTLRKGERQRVGEALFPEDIEDLLRGYMRGERDGAKAILAIVGRLVE